MAFKISVTTEDIEKLPMTSFGGEIHVISHVGPDYLRALAYLSRQKVIGFDTETRPVFTPDAPHNKVALLQLSGPDKAFLFRLNKMGLRRRVAAILARPDILKIGAASHDDVRGLQKRLQFEENGFVDLQKIAWEWGIRDKSVKKLAANILGIRISKTQQLSNWEADELSESQRKYAATDAWVCLRMYEELLKSEKHPLTPEELNPSQPQQQNQTRNMAPVLNEEKPRRRRPKRRHPKKKNENGETDTEKG